MSAGYIEESRGAMWNALPQEIQSLILKFIIDEDNCHRQLATVSRQWQQFVERENFARIKLTPLRATDFGSMTRRSHRHVRCIWFCWELDEYDCTTCAPQRRMMSEDEYMAAVAVDDTKHCRITMAFENLFETLNSWGQNGGLTLDISVHCHSDVAHWFPYLTFVPDTVYDPTSGDGLQFTQVAGENPGHRWPVNWRASRPFMAEREEYEWWEQLALAPAVSKLILRQQSRRQWKPLSLSRMFTRFPNLAELYYEPWRMWDGQGIADQENVVLLQYMAKHNTKLRKLVLFENFNQQYPLLWQRIVAGREEILSHSFRKPNPKVSRALVLASSNLEYIAVSFIADARYFLTAEPELEWPNLKSLVLTLELMARRHDTKDMQEVLQSAAAAMKKMPRLEILAIWTGRKGLATLFQYQVLPKAWEVAVSQNGHDEHWKVEIIHECLDPSAIKSHADAVERLELPEVMRPVSLLRIKMEQAALEATVASRMARLLEPTARPQPGDTPKDPTQQASWPYNPPRVRPTSEHNDHETSNNEKEKTNLFGQPAAFSQLHSSILPSEPHEPPRCRPLQKSSPTS
ncbi:hypothetical protein NLG97_g8965 [Lecanicillium saksenae]|uniref:Uncharacterized protein n=1 Tax=Lecanicillium saksenae TaxID=468837 RepID=A0ACC1QIM1_9HYPO|nr:hypothetical protein NLG97_g8965 [Lecanicillium saksenae]